MRQRGPPRRTCHPHRTRGEPAKGSWAPRHPDLQARQQPPRGRSRWACGRPGGRRRPPHRRDRGGDPNPATPMSWAGWRGRLVGHGI